MLGLDAGREDPSRRARRLRSGDAAFEDRHPRARLGEPQGGRAAVDPGADHDDVAVHLRTPLDIACLLVAAKIPTLPGAAHSPREAVC